MRVACHPEIAVAWHQRCQNSFRVKEWHPLKKLDLNEKVRITVPSSKVPHHDLLPKCIQREVIGETWQEELGTDTTH
jgi:hypothetical protein